MQKLDFVKNLETISTELNSVSIKKHFDNALHAPGNGYDFGQINPILFRSKSRFDQLVQNVNLNAILQSLGAFNVYREDNLSSLTTHLRSNSLRDIFLVKNCLELYNLHATILSTLSLSKTLLLNPSISESNEQSLENGIVVFQVSIVEDSLDIDTYIKIFSKLKELAELLNKVNKTDDSEENAEEIDIILLDSGSDTNIGLKAKIETAKSLFLIFKEIWDFITSHRFYKNKQSNDALLESLTIRKEILAKVEEGVISDEEAKEYLFIVKTRTDDLIGLKVLPKEVVNQNLLVDNQKLLNEYKELKLLNSKTE